MLEHLHGWTDRVAEGVLYLCGMPPAVSRNWIEQNATSISLLKWVAVIAVGGYVLIVRQDEQMKAHIVETALRFETERTMSQKELDEQRRVDLELRRVQLEVLNKLEALQIGQQKLQLEILRTHPDAKR